MTSQTLDLVMSLESTRKRALTLLDASSPISNMNPNEEDARLAESMYELDRRVSESSVDAEAACVLEMNMAKEMGGSSDSKAVWNRLSSGWMLLAV